MRPLGQELDPAKASENREAMEAACAELAARRSVVQEGGGAKARDKHTARGKLFVRDRIQQLIDPGSMFLEVAPFAADGVYDSSVPSAGMVCGIGDIARRPCMIVANDATVKGGTYFPLTVKKHLRAQEIAAENGLPCVYLVDSGGAFLPLQSEVFPDRDHFGRIFYNQAQLSAQGIPQIAAVMGSCTAGGAYVPSMCDESIIVRGTGTIYLAGPPLVKAAIGEDVDDQTLGGAETHGQRSGVVDHIAENDEECLQLVRSIVANLGVPHLQPIPRALPEAPKFPSEDLLGLIPADARVQSDVREVIARLVDASEFHEFKREYGTSLVTGFARIDGWSVGIVANNGVLFSESSLKGAHFVELCSQRGIPLVFLQNITGFMVGSKVEAGGIAKDGAKLVAAVSNANVPKFTVVIGGSFGAGNYGMCGRAFGPRMMWMWPNARISVMGGPQAAGVLRTVKDAQRETAGEPPLSEEEARKITDPVLQKYETEGSAWFASARLWDDGVIDPRETRAVLARAIEVSRYQPWPDRSHSVFRM
ncbi:MAG: methylcrotonoyl-CoA carboxylase [Phycisphaera sp. TMED151]|jgi:3-methylcrotonyl-CoA carboxylase beta subunit|nr:MAG: methylcrotonoyl-CoA carboxylase [Phycisphaera sp. TMED151]